MLVAKHLGHLHATSLGSLQNLALPKVEVQPVANPKTPALSGKLELATSGAMEVVEWLVPKAVSLQLRCEMLIPTHELVMECSQ